MRRRAGLIISCFLFVFRSIAAGDLSSAGGRAAGMGYGVTAITDSWSGFNNQAGLGWEKNFSASAYFENRFMVKELSLEAVGAVFPVKKGAIGITFRHFGFSAYNEMTAGTAFGMRFGSRFSAGISLDYIRIHFGEDYGSKNLFTFEIGFLFKPSDLLCLGFHVSNPYPVKLSNNPQENLPVIFRLGIAWQPTKNFLGSAEIEKDLRNRPVLKTGIEYQLVKPVVIRAGYLTTPSRFTFGFGLTFGNLNFGLAVQYHSVLGFSPQGSIEYSFE
jgi:hypothetical protein